MSALTFPGIRLDDEALKLRVQADILQAQLNVVEDAAAMAAADSNVDAAHRAVAIGNALQAQINKIEKLITKV